MKIRSCVSPHFIHQQITEVNEHTSGKCLTLNVESDTLLLFLASCKSESIEFFLRDAFLQLFEQRQGRGQPLTGRQIDSAPTVGNFVVACENRTWFPFGIDTLIDSGLSGQYVRKAEHLMDLLTCEWKERRQEYSQAVHGLKRDVQHSRRAVPIGFDGFPRFFDREVLVHALGERQCFLKCTPQADRIEKLSDFIERVFGCFQDFLIDGLAVLPALELPENAGARCSTRDSPGFPRLATSSSLLRRTKSVQDQFVSRPSGAFAAR